MREIILKNELWDIVRMTSVNMDSVCNPIVQSYGLTMMQSRILLAITKCEKANISCISQSLDVTSGNASNMCKRLEKEGFVKRIRSNDDERVVTLFLTNKGKETLDNINNEFMKKFKPILDGKSDEDFNVIIKGIKKLNELLKELEETTKEIKSTNSHINNIVKND